jgi:hypothetical protein
MIEQNYPLKQTFGLPMVWRLLLALAAGLALGGLGILLISQISWSIPGLCLPSPLLALPGVLGRLAAGVRTKRPLLSGFGLGGLAWFGLWLSLLLGVILLPETTSDCLHDCPPITQSFSDDEFAPLVLIFLGFLLIWGLLLVLGGAAVTHSMRKSS